MAGSGVFQMLGKLLSTQNDWGLALVRVMLGVVFFYHGAEKMLGWFGGAGFAGTMRGFTTFMHIPAPLAVLAIFAEFFGGIGLIVGLLSRIAAFGITVNMVVAIFTLNGAYGFSMNWTGRQKGEGYEFHLLVIAITLAIIGKGAGAWSLDRALSKSTSR